MDTKKDYYAILGVSKTATKDEITLAFRKKAKECHPDRFTDEKEKRTAEVNFKEIGEAYEVLSKESDRQLYDSSFNAGPSYGYANPFAGVNTDFFKGVQVPEDDFSDLFQSIYSSSPSAAKTTEEVLNRKTGGR